MGFLSPKARPLPLKDEYDEEYCERCKEFTTHKLEPCVGWFCIKCGHEHKYE